MVEFLRLEIKFGSWVLKNWTVPSMPQATSTDPPVTPPVPPAAPPTLEDFIIVSGSEFRAIVLLFRTLTATHNALHGRHTCSTGLTYYYPSLDSATSGTFTTSNWHSWTIRAHSSSWRDDSSSRNPQSRCPVPGH